jgi:hypothetical protein
MTSTFTPSYLGTDVRSATSRVSGPVCESNGLRASRRSAHLGAVQQRLRVLNEKLGFAPLSLNVGALDVDPHTLAAMIVREAEVRRAPATEPYRE